MENEKYKNSEYVANNERLLIISPAGLCAIQWRDGGLAHFMFDESEPDYTAAAEAANEVLA